MRLFLLSEKVVPECSSTRRRVDTGTFSLGVRKGWRGLEGVGRGTPATPSCPLLSPAIPSFHEQVRRIG